MSKTEVLKHIQEAGLLPVLRADSAVQALALAKAIEAGGITALEVTMTVPDAIEVIRSLVRPTAIAFLSGPARFSILKLRGPASSRVLSSS